MGFAFAFGVVAVMLRRPERMLVQRVVDVTALATSIIIPLSMNSRSGSAGLLQRTMFLIAYLWYATEAWGTLRRTNAGS
jgi:ABC-type transport system involved in cytochrome c biogenesis permease subunit